MPTQHTLPTVTVCLRYSCFTLELSQPLTSICYSCPPIQVITHDLTTSKATIYYATGEEEEADLLDLVAKQEVFF